MSTRQALERLAQRVDAAYNDGDAASMAACWTDDGLNINPFGDRIEGRANIAADLDQALSGFMKGSRHELVITAISSLDERTAVADGTATITGIVGFDGTPMEPLSSSFSMICVRDGDDDWQIVQMRAYRFIPKQG